MKSYDPVRGGIRRTRWAAVALCVTLMITALAAPVDATGVVTSGLQQHGQRQGIHLDLKTTVVSPGQRIRFRVVNDSSMPVAYGEEFSIQKRTPSGWRRAAFSPRGPWAEDELQVSAGGRGQWQIFRIRVRAAPGRYRVVKAVSFRSSSRHLTAAFRVVV